MKILLLTALMVLPTMALAAGEAQQFQNQISLGAGYYVPSAAPQNVDVLRSKFDVHLPNGLDCSGLDLQTQMKAELTSGLSMRDLETVGQNALGASASYLAASFRPTWYETWQNALKEANKAVQTNLLECRAIEQQLKDTDPLDLYAKNQQATKTAELASSGMNWKDAKTQASNTDVDWKIKDLVATSGRPVERKANLLAVVGDLSFRKKAGVSAVGGDLTDSQTLDAIYRDGREVIAGAVRKRFNGEDDCTKPLFADDLSVQMRKTWLADLEGQLAKGQKGEEVPEFDRKKTWLMAMQNHLSVKPDPWTSCGSVASWREDFLPEDRAAVVNLISNTHTLRALGLSLRDASAELKMLKLKHPDQAKVIDEISPLPQLAASYADLKTEILEREKMVRSLVLAHQRAEQERRTAADKRQAGRTEYKGVQTPPGRF